MDILCLGPVRAFEGDREIPLGGPKQRLVLAHLLTRPNATVQADRLIEEVWGDAPPDGARSSLHSYVSHLRRALGQARIESRDHGYGLRIAPEELDALRVEALATTGHALLATDPAAASRVLTDALELWRGPPFADLADAVSLGPAIARLESLRWSIVEDRIAAELELGHAGQLVGELEALTTEQPLRERGWEFLLLALYRSGRQAEAMAAYARARRLLTEQYGIEPSARLRSLHTRVLQQDPALEVAPRALRGYQLQGPIGRGHRDVVHRAWQPQVGREVAVKIIRAELANRPAFIRRFDAEAQAVAQLEHPYVVPLYDYWREPDAAYLVMRLMRGGSLREALDREEPLPDEVMVRVGEQVTEGLAAAHAQGVVHHEVDPTHVLLDEAGNALLGGFGLGRAVTDGGGQEGPSRYAGDVHALGTLLHELSGEPEEAGDGVAAVIRRATLADPAARYVDAAALLADLRAVRRRGRSAADGSLGTPRQPALRNPYKGLRPFTEADVLDFFGREALTARLLTRLREDPPADRFLAVVGPSGSGKSSVVRAGLVPALRSGALPGSEGWFVAQMTPGEDPFHGLEVALRQIAVDPRVSIARRLADDGAPLAQVIEEVLPTVGGELLVVVDQFEELFTLVDDHRRERFLAMLAEAVTGPSGRVRVVITLRADLYDRPLRHPALADLLRTRTEVVVPLTPEELERAVRAPAERVGVAVESGLVARVVNDLTSQPGALPLLQYALTELFDRRSGPVLTAEVYGRVGGVTGALARRAEAVFTTLADPARDAARQLFLRLVTLGDGVDDMRRRASDAELRSLDADPEGMGAAIEAFGAARLLSFDRDPETRGPTVEVAHESLLRGWDRLGTWIDAAREDVRTHRRLAAAVQEWVAAGRDPSFLLTGVRLEQSEAWRERSGLATTVEERAFLDASVADRDDRRAQEAARRARETALERRSYRRLQALVGALCVAALVASGLTIFGFSQRDRAQQETVRAAGQAAVATARELAASSVASLDVDPDRSILLALESVERSRSLVGEVLPEAEEALHRAVGASRLMLNVRDLGGMLSWSADGSIFVTEGPEDSGLIDVRDAASGEPVRSWHGHDVDVNDVAFSPDGSRLATTGDDGAARVWDPAAGEELVAVIGDGEVWGPSWSPDASLLAATWTSEQVARVVDTASGEVMHEWTGLVHPWATAFSPDGDLVAVSDQEGAVHVFDATTGDAVQVMDGHHARVNEVAWSPDGAWIATASTDTDVRLWDASTFEPRSTLAAHHDGVAGLAWSPDSRRMVTGSADGTAKVWDVTADGGTEALSLSADDLRGIVGVAFSPDGERVMLGDMQVAAVQVWDVGLQGDGEWANYAGDSEGWNSAGFTLDGDDLVTTGPSDHGAVVWDQASGDERFSIRPHEDVVTSIAVAPHTGTIATAGGTSVVTTDARTGERVLALTEDSPINDVAWGPDGAVMAMASREGPIRVVDAAGEELASLPWGEGHAAWRVAFSPDGRLVGAVRWSVGRFEPGEPEIRLWDWASGAVERSIASRAVALAFDPTGHRLATAHPSGDIEVWDLVDGERMATLSGHHGSVFAMAFSPDGSRLVTGGSDTTVRVWDLDAYVQVLQLYGHRGLVSEVAYDPGGDRLVSADAQGVVRVWAMQLDDLTAMAHAKLTRSLTPEECLQYLHVARCP